MKIDNLVRIVDGVLQTTPSIDAFETIAFDCERVGRGDLFIDTTHSMDAIHTAIAKGAYAILSEHPFWGDDKEIAWMHVSSLEQSVIKLLRYRVAQNTLHVIHASPIHRAFLQLIHTPSSIIFAQGTLFDVAKVILKLNHTTAVCLEDASLCVRIAPSHTTIEKSVSINASHKGLFLSSFWWKERYYNDVKLPMLFWSHFTDVLHLCEMQSIPYSLETLSFTEHFYPQFVTPSLRKKEFGSSDHVLIFEPCIELLEQEISTLQTVFPSQDWCVFLPKNVPFTKAIAPQNLFIYTSVEALRLLSSQSFRYALILGERSTFESLLSEPFISQPTLF
jgi:ferrochelatase